MILPIDSAFVNEARGVPEQASERWLALASPGIAGVAMRAEFFRLECLFKPSRKQTRGDADI